MRLAGDAQPGVASEAEEQPPFRVRAGVDDPLDLVGRDVPGVLARRRPALERVEGVGVDDLPALHLAEHGLDVAAVRPDGRLGQAQVLERPPPRRRVLSGDLPQRLVPVEEREQFRLRLPEFAAALGLEVVLPFRDVPLDQRADGGALPLGHEADRREFGMQAILE
ncbi:MAG: hypothetical protein LW831_13755 [Phycisphaeraceae bacterium]|nr:hypothetical protein [Phycisphaeraceae bacterium]